MFLYIITIIANPTLTSAAATTIIKKTNSCASVPAVKFVLFAIAVAYSIFENATSKRFAAFSISSMHIKIIMALRRVKTPTTPMQNKQDANAM